MDSAMYLSHPIQHIEVVGEMCGQKQETDLIKTRAALVGVSCDARNPRWHVSFVRFFGVWAGLIFNGTVQTVLIFMIYIADIVLLTVLRPFSNSFIQWIEQSLVSYSYLYI